MARVTLTDAQQAIADLIPLYLEHGRDQLAEWLMANGAGREDAELVIDQVDQAASSTAAHMMVAFATWRETHPNAPIDAEFMRFYRAQLERQVEQLDAAVAPPRRQARRRRKRGTA